MLYLQEYYNEADLVSDGAAVPPPLLRNKKHSNTRLHIDRQHHNRSIPHQQQISIQSPDYIQLVQHHLRLGQQFIHVFPSRLQIYLLRLVLYCPDQPASTNVRF